MKVTVCGSGWVGKAMMSLFPDAYLYSNGKIVLSMDDKGTFTYSDTTYWYNKSPKTTMITATIAGKSYTRNNTDANDFCSEIVKGTKFTSNWFTAIEKCTKIVHFTTNVTEWEYTPCGRGNLIVDKNGIIIGSNRPNTCDYSTTTWDIVPK